jgi:hypothetical protein
MLSQHLIETYKLPTNRNLITCLDNFKIYRDMASYQKDLVEFAMAHESELTTMEKYVITMETHPLRQVMYLMSQTHFNNYLSDIYFLISNTQLKDTFEVIYGQRKHLMEVADEMINMFDKVFNQSYLLELGDRKFKLNLSSFYSWTMISRLIDSFDYPTPEFHNVDSKLEDYWDNYFVPASIKVQDYLIQLEDSKEKFEGLVGGLSQFPSEVYQYIVKYYVGLEVNETKLGEWEKIAELQIKMLMREVSRLGRKLFKIEDSYETYLKLFQSAPSQKWENADEMVNSHKQTMTKYQSYFNDKLGFKTFGIPDPQIYVFDDPDLAGGYYYNGFFFLNKFDWESTRKYDVRSLVLHETVPGHHLQMQIANKLYPDDILPNLYGLTTGFIEGWGLFSESLHNREVDLSDQSHEDNHLWDRYGELQMEILRTLRIIIDVGFHVHGKTPEDQIEMMKKYLSCGQNIIESEVYRYLSLPGQALSYKIGQIQIKNLFKGNDLYDPDHIAKYKELLSQPEKPLFMYDPNFTSMTLQTSTGGSTLATATSATATLATATSMLEPNLCVDTGDGFVTPL